MQTSSNSRAKTVGQIFKVVGGGTPTTTNPNFWNGSIPWATSADLDDDLEITPRKRISREAIASSATNLVPAGSIIVATRVGLGKVGVARTDLCFSQDCQGLIFQPDICDSTFAALQLKLRVQTFKYISRGTTIAGVTKKQLLDVPFDLPSLTEQQRIVAEIEKQFTRLETGVAALQSTQAKLKRYRAAILKAACEGRLVPTEAELAKKENRSYEPAEILLRRILKERRQKWNGKGKYKEPLAPIASNLLTQPDGWTWATIDQLAAPEPNSITDGPFGSNLKTEHYTDSGPRVIRLQNIGDGVYIDEEAHISEAHFQRLQKHRVYEDDLVIAAFGENPPRSCMIPGALGPAIVKADCIRFKPHREIAAKYMNAALNSDPVRKRTKGMVHGVGRPRLNLGEIKSIVLPVPPLAEQRRVIAEVERRLSVIGELEAVASTELQRAKRLRQSILQQAFLGGLATTLGTGSL